MFIVFGPVILAVSIPMDSINFCYNLYTKPPVQESKMSVSLTEQDLVKFEECLNMTLKEKRQNVTGEKEKASTEVNYVALNKFIQKEFKV